MKTENQNLTINLTSDQLSKLQGQAVVVTFKAKIRANVNLSDYITDGAVKVPNVANITVDNKTKSNVRTSNRHSTKSRESTDCQGCKW
ncbi:isopeptide-forming domain-containing fimbrial protein, partial [Streptococcus suis]